MGSRRGAGPDLRILPTRDYFHGNHRENLLSKKNPNKTTKKQEQFEYTEPTFVTYQLTISAALRFLVIKIDHVLATPSSLCHSQKEKADISVQGEKGELQGF